MALSRVSKLKPYGQPGPSTEWNPRLPAPTGDSAGRPTMMMITQMR